jgi:ABC-2 type transport system permease protein
MIRLIRTELLKLRTIRASYGLLAAAVAMTALEAILTASRAGGGGPGGIPGLGTVAGLTAVVTSTDVAILLAMVFGATVASGEFRHGTATATYLATPDRNRVLLAKAFAAAGAGLLLGLAAAAVATGAGLAFVAAKGMARSWPRNRRLAISVSSTTRGWAIRAPVSPGCGCRRGRRGMPRTPRHYPTGHRCRARGAAQG